MYIFPRREQPCASECNPPSLQDLPSDFVNEPVSNPLSLHEDFPSDVEVVSKPLSLQDLPSDVWGEIFCRLSCEITLLGAVAKVNREFREIALEQSTRNCVRARFVEAHKKACFDCSSMVHIGSVSSEDFFSAVAEGYFACVRYISDVTCEEFTLETDDESWTVLHHATTLGRLDMIRYFIEEKGASSLMTHFDVEGKTVLHYAAIAGRLDIFRYFVERGASYIVAGVDKAGWSALHLAGWYGCAHVVRYVVERLGVMSLSTATYDKGETVLHHAAGRGHIEIVRYVVERGATGLLEQENNMGETALGVARKSPYSNKRVVDYLFSKM